jgi:hypothetical protein
MSGAIFTALADTNANPQPHTFCRLQWHDTRRLSNSVGRGNLEFMARHVERGSWCRLVTARRLGRRTSKILTVGLGPAHAVYFATYEAVKHVMGGNQAGVHHPLAAGRSW